MWGIFFFTRSRAGILTELPQEVDKASAKIQFKKYLDRYIGKVQSD